MAVAAKIAGLPEIHQMLYRIEDGINIVLVGVGGTGCIVASSALKMIGALPENTKSRVNFTAVDFDLFEPKNLGRQLCIPPDMGKNKAKVIVQRYAPIYNITEKNANYVDKKIESPEDVIALLQYAYTNIIIDCVDKNAPRQHIHNAMKIWSNKLRYGATYVISCGNGEWNGQVGMGGIVKEDGRILRHTKTRTPMDPPYIFSVPSPYVVCPELLDLEEDKREEAMSCADRALLNAQSMVANATSACLGLNYLNAAIAQFNNQIQDKANVPQINGLVRFNAQNNGFSEERLLTTYLDKELV